MGDDDHFLVAFPLSLSIAAGAGALEVVPAFTSPAFFPSSLNVKLI